MKAADPKYCTGRIMAIKYFTDLEKKEHRCLKKSTCTVFILHFAPSLRFTVSLQSSFYTQSAFYPWSEVCSLQIAVCVLHWRIHQIDRTWIVASLQLLCSVWKSATGLQNRCRELQRAFKGCTALLHPASTKWSCCLASKMLLNSCNLAVQLFWSDFFGAVQRCKFRTGPSTW